MDYFPRELEKEYVKTNPSIPFPKAAERTIDGSHIEKLPDQHVGNQDVYCERLLTQRGINEVGSVSCLTTGSWRSPHKGLVMRME